MLLHVMQRYIFERIYAQKEKKIMVEGLNRYTHICNNDS